MADFVSSVGSFSFSSDFANSTRSMDQVQRTRQFIQAPPAQDVQPAQSFADAMADAMKTTAQEMKTAEATSIAGIKGEVSAQQVVEAVMKAEVSLKTALAVRDKVVAAYQEFSRMAI